MLHGARNDPAEGGSALSNIKMARDFEAALRRAGKPVEFAYYKDGKHNTVFTNSAQYEDEVRKDTDVSPTASSQIASTDLSCTASRRRPRSSESAEALPKVGSGRELREHLRQHLRNQLRGSMNHLDNI